MQKTIQQITEKLIDRLPENSPYYRLDELRSLDLPPFIVRRIAVELKRNLSDSMNIPQTDWANTNSEAVLDAWQHFIEAIREEVRLPASYAQAVIETAVSEVIEILVQPRKNLPEVIFGSKVELSAEQLEERLEALVVYRHFAVLLLRYFEKKELNTLSKERCATIIAKADKKLTSGYSPLNWAQLLEPLFRLLDDNIDTNVLRLFFEDKNKPRVARKFDLMDTVLSRAELIEVLSSPDLLDFEGYEDNQSSLFEDQPPANADKNSETVNVQAKCNEKEDKSSLKVEDKHFVKESPPQTASETKLQVENRADEQDSLNAFFKKSTIQEPQEEVTSDIEDTEENEPDRSTSHKKHVIESSNREHIDKDNDAASENRNSVHDHDDNEKEDWSEAEYSDDNHEETPMWMRFMSDEEIEKYKKDHKVEEDEDLNEDEYMDDPIIDLTEEDVTEEETEAVYRLLSDDREMFVENIFRGSDRAFDQAIEQLAAFDNWRDVSKYIEKDIFKRNMVDLYSEAVVEFTDRLQSYFLEKQNRNKQEN